ncbi:hypothetical protein SBOR_2270 [Sclerotinia borealis F-4128]|uniref:Peptidase A1 domain-containing protein n=1 Tax=Sclerotinia borealis (strain F-4128) TaxID=1432307 RepID=W9CS96_SCLBF|nr:hypothetical protein SBOR_2270 [Sclerotinia borealis F-4128]
MRNIRCKVGFLIFTITASIFARSVDSDVDFKSYYETRKDIAEFIPAPIVVPPSQYFEGVNGHWSTFNVRVGTPATSVRVIISTNSPATLVVLPGGCTTNAIDPVPADCADSRGGTFNNTSSKTWIDQGIFGINGVRYGFEANLGYNFDADYGLDTLGLGYSDSADGPTLKNQTVAAYALASPLFTGVFGLGRQPVIYQTFGNVSVPSFFQSLRNQKLIPSLSWSYTAGAKYRLKAGQFAQLIFGGFDASRYQPSPITFSLNADVTRDLLVGIQAIIYQGQATTSLLQDPIYAFVESTDPNIWLPLSACLLFEKAFGLVWNETISMYLINSTQYNLLSGTDPTVTFTLANTISGGSTVNIQLPFSAFALQGTYPFVDNTTYYFPLKRAANDTQYTLGRVFLQEAYLTVDYDRCNFSINQCTWIDGATSNVIAIKAPSNETSNSSNDTSSSSDKYSPKPISTGTIAGIAIGVFTLIFISSAAFFFYRHKQHKRARDSQLIVGTLALTDIQSNITTDNDKKPVTPSEHNSLAPSSELYSPEPQDHMLKQAPYISSILSRNESISHTPNSGIYDTEREIYQLNGESKKVELGNTDTGYRFELTEERLLPVELSGESMEVQELVSPTLGEEGRFVQLRGLRNGGTGAESSIGRLSEGVTSWRDEWPEIPETGVVMGYGPSEKDRGNNRTGNRE